MGVRDPFELMFVLETVTIPLNMKGLENDETIYVVTDLDMKPSQETNFDGAVDRKIVGKLELKTIVGLEAKRFTFTSQTFSTKDGSSHEAFLQATPISVQSWNDVRHYKNTSSSTRFFDRSPLYSRKRAR